MGQGCHGALSWHKSQPEPLRVKSIQIYSIPCMHILEGTVNKYILKNKTMLQGFQGYLKCILVHQRPNNKVLSPCIAPETCQPGHGPLGRLGRMNILFWVRSHPHWTATSCQTCPTRRYLTANRSRGTTMVMERAANCRFRGERRCRQASVTFWQEQSKIGQDWLWEKIVILKVDWRNKDGCWRNVAVWGGGGGEILLTAESAKQQ